MTSRSACVLISLVLCSCGNRHEQPYAAGVGTYPPQNQGYSTVRLVDTVELSCGRTYPAEESHTPIGDRRSVAHRLEALKRATKTRNFAKAQATCNELQVVMKQYKAGVTIHEKSILHGR